MIVIRHASDVFGVCISFFFLENKIITGHVTISFLNVPPMYHIQQRKKCYVHSLDDDDD